MEKEKIGFGIFMSESAKDKVKEAKSDHSNSRDDSPIASSTKPSEKLMEKDPFPKFEPVKP